MPVAARPDEFHPAIAAWFARRFPDGPSAPQAEGWPPIRAGADTLIAAPTGSGKTLAGFLVAIDAAYRAHADGEDIARTTRVVYVSPLKALAVDIHQNLEEPLAEIADMASAMGLPVPPITVGVRTGDTTAGARTAMVRNPPTFVVTTPESLYLLVTAQRSREALGQVRTIIVDEIHALARDKRGAHLALTLERLEHLQGGPRPQRIGLSATQRPLEQTARLLSGLRTGDMGTGGRGTGGGAAGGPVTAVVDCGQRRELDVSIELPDTELGAVASTEQFGEVVDRIARHVRAHRTTLVFVNTRRLSERLAHLLGERLGPDRVAAHHGSLSKDRRQRVERRLRAGDLRALVATASLELGIDIGPVELVCQVGSPRAMATLVQRVGRSNHTRGGTPKGILYPLTRDELVECAALLAAVRAGRLDVTHPPVAPLDILVQQIVAEVAAAGEWAEDDLLALVRRAAPYADVTRQDYDAVLELASEGITTGRGTRLAYLHRDRVNGVLRPRRGARLAAITSGGAIPEVGDYRVIADPDDTPVGTVNEDFAIESMVGDVFLLGTHSWRVRRVTQGEMRVTDAEGAHPTIPFWVGEAPSRTDELSDEVSDLRRAVGERLALEPADAGRAAACHLARETCGLDRQAAEQLVDYLAAGLGGLGVLPTRHDIVFERFFDEAGGMQMVVHAPVGGRLNRGFGLALRKRFCATFDFELQAAANDDAVVLSLGPQHSFPLDAAPRLLHWRTARATLEQAVLASPLFTARWRWNLNRSLAVLRFRGGRRTPLPVQRMESDDLMAAVFPALAACQENAPAGPVHIPDHILVRQTLHDCLHEAMDIDGLLAMLRRIESGEIRVHVVDTTEPSVLAHEILNGKPYTFLDDAPLEERRTRAVQMRRGLPLQAAALARLDPAAVRRVRDEAAPQVRDVEELHDLLVQLVISPPVETQRAWFAALCASGRAASVDVTDASAGGGARELWCAVERRAVVEALFPGVACRPDHPLPASLAAAAVPDADVATADALRGHLDALGPATVTMLAARTALAPGRVAVGLARLEAEGFALRGHFDAELDEVAGDGAAIAGEQWCARRLLARIHAYTQHTLRRAIEPVTARDFVRFLLRWQHVAPGSQYHGRAGVLAVVDQLQGFEIAAGAWEESVLPARVQGYQARWLEDLCLSGELVWGRLALRGAGDDTERRGAATPSRATPLTFARRDDLPWLLLAARGTAPAPEPAHGAARDVLDALRRQGAMFHAQLRDATGRLPIEVEEGLWDLVARGIVTADGFEAVRSLFTARQAWARRHRPEPRARVGARRAPTWRTGGEGRWALLPPAGTAEDPDGLAEQVAGQLLARWGVVFWDLVARENLALPWREVVWALRRLEARGLVRGGRFVSGFAGEQYALAEAVDELRGIRRSAANGELVRLSAADPLNLIGIALPGPRVPAVRAKRITYLDGLPAADSTATGGGPAPAAGTGPA